MKPAVDKHHLIEYSGEFYRHFVAIDIDFGQVDKVVNSTALDIFHNEDSLGGRDDLWNVERCPRILEISDCPCSVGSFVHEVHFFGQIDPHLLLE